MLDWFRKPKHRGHTAKARTRFSGGYNDSSGWQYPPGPITPGTDIQIVKGWFDSDGATQEMVYNVVWGDAKQRELDSDVNIPLVVSTVDVANAKFYQYHR